MMAPTPASRDQTEAERRFAAAYQQHYRAVLAYFLRRMGTPADAADAAAESFAIAWRRVDDLPPEESLPWLYGIARRVLANQRRGERRRTLLHQRLRELPATAAHDGDDVAVALAEALGCLSTDDRELLILTAWEGLPPREIAQVLHVPAAVVSVRLHRAKRRLRAHLAAVQRDPESRSAGAISTAKEVI
jgi:RNA polymerase sigma factor (sigma-70 family)